MEPISSYEQPLLSPAVCQVCLTSDDPLGLVK